MLYIYRSITDSRMECGGLGRGLIHSACQISTEQHEPSKSTTIQSIMTARTVHKWHVALLSALLVVSLASFGLTAGFIEYTKRVPIRIQVPGESADAKRCNRLLVCSSSCSTGRYTPGSRYNLGGIYTIRGIYFHANGLVVAAGVISFLTSLYL
jgi:hypothetical protein